MKKKPERFEPEFDGKGKVQCPVKQKDLKRLNAKRRTNTMAAALIAAGLSR